MKVLHILNELRASGMEKMLESSGEYWKNYNVQGIIIGNGISHPFKSNLELAGYQVITIPRLKSLTGLVKYCTIVRKLDVDVIHNHAETLHGFIAILNRLLFPKILLFRTVHNCFSFSGIDYKKRKIQDLMEKISRVKRITPSRDVYDHELNFWGNKSHIVENWINIKDINLELEKSSSTTKDGLLRILLIGNCSPVKNHELLFSIIHELPKVEIFHVGDPRDMSEIEKNSIRNLEVIGVGIHNAQTSNPYDFYSKADIHIVTSLTEGFGLVIAESVLFGIPTIVNNVRGVQWARGLGLVEYFDTSDDLIEIITKYSDRKKELDLKTLAQQDNNLEFRFSPERGVSEYVQHYRNSYPQGRQIGSFDLKL